VPRQMNTRDRVAVAIFGRKQPRKETVNVKWYRRSPVTMNAKLRQAILDVLPFDVSQEKADLILRTIFDTITEGVIRDKKAVIPGLGKFYLKYIRPMHGIKGNKRTPTLYPAHYNMGFEASGRFKKKLRDEENPYADQ
jgi:nucleoid DNA-binding protein